MKSKMGRLRAMAAMAVVLLLTILLGGVALLVGLICAPRGLMNWCSHVWSAAVLKLAGVRLEVVGADRAAALKPAFFLGNHQSDLDIPIIICALRGQVRFMAKDSLFRIPLFGWVIRRYGYVPIDRGNVRRTMATLRSMLEGMKSRPISMTAFPEGTRSRDGRLLPFRRGTMKIVQQAGLPVVPFSIDGSIEVHHPDRFFSLVPGMVRLAFGEPISAEQAVAMEQDDLQGRVIGAIASNLGQPVPGGHTDSSAGNPLPLGAAV